MKPVFEAHELCRSYGETVALDRVDLRIDSGEVVGLIGRNGSGKSTLLGHVLGLLLPSSGRCATYGVEGAKLDAPQLRRIGAVFQANRLLGWMSVEQHLRYAEAFHKHWDREREGLLLGELGLDRGAQVMKLSPGNAQKLALVLAACSRPEFLVLDEPLASLDPIAREKLLAFLLELVREDDATVVISSHVLRDVERIVSRVVCLDHGRVAADAELDDLLEGFGQWRVVTRNGSLPAAFDEEFILGQEAEGAQARLWVRAGECERAAFAERHHVQVERFPMALEDIFPLLVGEEPRR